MRLVLQRFGSYLPAAVAIALPTLFLPNTVDSFILPRASIVIGAACLGVGIALLAPQGPGLGRLRLPIVAAAAAAVLAFAFSVSWPLSFTGAYTRYESLPMRLAYLALLAVPVWLLRDERSRSWVVAAFVFGTAVASLEALMQAAAGVAFRPDGNVGNANLLGALIAMAFPLAVARGLGGGRFAVAWWMAVIVLAAGLVASTSRSGGLGALAGCLALVVFAFRRSRWVVVSLLASGALLATSLWAIVLGPLGRLNNDPARSRLQLWPDALHMIVARPFTGWGEDATGLVFGRFLSADWSPGVTFDRAHSGALDIAAMLGVLGVAALAWVLVVLFRGVWERRSAGSVGALGAACVGYTVWVLFNFDWAPATGVFWLLAGTAWSGVRAAESENATSVAVSAPAVPRVWRSLGAVALVAAAIGLAVLPVLADAWYYQGRTDLSVAADPLQSRYHWVHGQELLAEGKARQGVAELRRAAELGETEPQLYVDLGDGDALLGDRAQARRDYLTALKIDPYYAPAIQRLAGQAGSG